MNTISEGIKRPVLWILVLAAFISGCVHMKVDKSSRLILPVNARIAVGPFANHSDTPMANRQVESILVSLLQAKGFTQISHYQRQKSCEKLLYCPDETLSRSKILHWARLNHIQYIFLGAANEWRYKVGLDGEPVAGVSMLVIDAASGRTLWTAVGSVIGGSRSGLDVVGQSLLRCLLASIYPAPVITYISKTIASK